MVIPGSDPESAFPERLGRYEVLLPIASGGMARVFLACSTALGGFEREVALKITHEHLRENLQFFTALIDEARLAGRIRHPNVVSVLDVGEAPDGAFIVMDYVEGESLAGLAKKLAARGESLPIEVSLRVLDDVLSGLHAAHELTDADGLPLSVVHRDVTPHNVLLGIDGVSRITDFGVAKAASRLTKTMTGVVKGKVAYMAPEQARTGPVDRTCDVWAVGVLAWEMLTGLRMHEGLNDYALLLKITRDPPPRLRHVRPDLPRAFDEVLARALEMRPTARFPSAEAFAEALSQAARASGIYPAEARGVKAFVTPHFLPELEVRRELASRIRRARLGGSAAEFDRPSRPSSARLEALRPSVPPSAPPVVPRSEPPLASSPRASTPLASAPLASAPLASAPRSFPEASAVTLTDTLGPSIPADALDAGTGLDATAAPTHALVARPRTRTWLVLAAALSVPALGAAITLARGRDTSPPAPTGAPLTPPPPQPTLSTAVIVTPAELPVETGDEAADAATISPTDLGLERGRRLFGRVPKPAPPPTPSYSQPEPRANPYKH